MSDSSICLRIEHIKATASQAGHDLRSGHAPEYIDTQRSHLNDILVPYKSNADIKAINESIRSKHKLRAIRSDQSIARAGCCRSLTSRKNPLMRCRAMSKMR